MRLNAPRHTEVVRLEAIDPDAESGPVFYKLLNVSFIRAHQYASSGGDTQIDSSPTVAKTFDLDARSGLLTTSQTYGLFVNGYFLLHVCAWTGEESHSRKAFNTLKVMRHFSISNLHEYNLYRYRFTFCEIRIWCSLYLINRPLMWNLFWRNFNRQLKNSWHCRISR